MLSFIFNVSFGWVQSIKAEEVEEDWSVFFNATTNLFFRSLVVECRRLPDFRGFPAEPKVSLVILVRKQSSAGPFLFSRSGKCPE